MANIAQAAALLDRAKTLCRMAAFGAFASLALAAPNDGFTQAQRTLPLAALKVGVAPEADLTPECPSWTG
jgi:hypothetical protein